MTIKDFTKLNVLEFSLVYRRKYDFTYFLDTDRLFAETLGEQLGEITGEQKKKIIDTFLTLKRNQNIDILLDEYEDK
jgi:hypothetical protein